MRLVLQKQFQMSTMNAGYFNKMIRNFPQQTDTAMKLMMKQTVTAVKDTAEETENSG